MSALSRTLFFVPVVLLAFTQGATAVDFATQVHPILAARCAPCHNSDKPPAGLTFTSRAAALKGGADGPAITPGDSEHSLLILKVTRKKGQLMPPVGEPLSAEQISILKSWIDEGAVWPDTNPAGSNAWVAPIAPRRPDVPAGSESNPIDRFVAAYADAAQNRNAPTVSDAVFARRVYFDVWACRRQQSSCRNSSAIRLQISVSTWLIPCSRTTRCMPATGSAGGTTCCETIRE